ncbi:Hypothetical predicted protein [Octopus vulgaris]|uniref:Uncharacterized protein n=1 Tax=Octopus vulgaris TaxID=6645 RepID=A0AA36AP37_OCTVU|nr:Hypothetical predicted protein [Octopus vulgaris]
MLTPGTKMVHSSMSKLPSKNHLISYDEEQYREFSVEFSLMFSSGGGGGGGNSKNIRFSIVLQKLHLHHYH